MRISMKLVRNSKPLASIYLQASAGETERFAALELQRYLKQISGVKFSICRKEPKRKAVIRLMTNSELGSNRLEQEELLVETGEDSLVLAGGCPRALLYAVYEFLEVLGCRWFYPVQQEEIIPKHKTLEFSSISLRKKPTLAYRGFFPTPLNGQNLSMLVQFVDWMAKNRMNLLLTSPFDYEDPDTHGICDNLKWGQVKKLLLPEIRKRGILMDMGEHNVDELFPKELFHEHPEWFSLIGETRVPRQICYSNLDAVNYYAQRLVEYIAQNPQEAHIVGTWPQDGGNYCECVQCKPKDVILKAINRVARAVRKHAQDMIVEYLAYTPQTYEVVKGTLPEENMSIMVCKRNKMKDWIQHSALAGAKGAFLFEYQWADNYNQQGKILLRPGDVTHTTIKMARMGAKGIVVLLIPPHNWWSSGLNNYFFARSAWTERDESDRWLADYVSSYYCEAAEPMVKFFHILLKQEDFLVSKNKIWGCVEEDEHREFSRTVRAGRRALKQAALQTVKDTTRTRIRRCSNYLEFYNKWIGAQYFRQTADNIFAAEGKAAKSPVLRLMGRVERLEHEMIAMTRADDSRAGGCADGVLESELFRIRSTGRIEQDLVLRQKVQNDL